jgi:hypothetical protein
MRQDKQQTFSMVTGDYISGRAEKNSVEAGSNTLRIVGDNEKESLKYETVKYGHENKGTRTQEALRWRGPVACT